MRYPVSMVTKVVLIGGLGIAATLLGGCTRPLRDENARLKTEVDSLTQANSEKDATIQAMQQGRGGVRADKGDTSGGDITTGDPFPEPRNSRSRDGGQVRIEVAGDVLFDSGSTAVKSSAKGALDKVVSQLKNQYSGSRIRVEGYTDSDPPKRVAKKYPTNEALSQARAEAVEAYLIARGVPAERITAVGMGAAKQRASKAASRRVEVVVLGQ